MQVPWFVFGRASSPLLPVPFRYMRISRIGFFGEGSHLRTSRRSIDPRRSLASGGLLGTFCTSQKTSLHRPMLLGSKNRAKVKGFSLTKPRTWVNSRKETNAGVSHLEKTKPNPTEKLLGLHGLGPPARCPFSHLFWREGSPTKTDCRKKGTLILTSLPLLLFQILNCSI